MKNTNREAVDEPQTTDVETIRYSADRLKRTQGDRPAAALSNFGIDATADGLFHPESTIQAFSEHDAKFSVSTLKAGKNSQSESRLPVLKSGSQRGTLEKGGVVKSKHSVGTSERSLPSSRSDTSLRVMPTESNYFIRNSDQTDKPHDRKSGLKFPTNVGTVSVNQENGSNSTAPARIQTCPHELGRHESTHTSVKVPLLPLSQMSLAEKYQELKQIMRSNRSTRRQCATTLSSECKKSIIGNMSKDSHDTSSRQSKSVMRIVSLKKSKQPVRNRNGVSLADLREEHRQALEMLRELEAPTYTCEVDKQSSSHFEKETSRQSETDSPSNGNNVDSIYENAGDYENEVFEDS